MFRTKLPQKAKRMTASRKTAIMYKGIVTVARREFRPNSDRSTGADPMDNKQDFPQGSIFGKMIHFMGQVPAFLRLCQRIGGSRLNMILR